ncbi:SDR family oxidoreductase [Dactylosporangium maewongense]|uniref:SDR family oxidoreductase n=1 Tax=Dactylosporangium maewongense TaxID=634393 RepID=A0ABN2B7D9_9ACTN
MIIIGAANGALGRLVIDHLRTHHPHLPLTAAVRDPTRCTDLTTRGVDVRHGDYDDPDTLRTAFQGADRLLLISSPELDPDRRTRQHRNALDAAVAAGVRTVAYTSFLGADRSGDGLNAAHHATERAIADSGLPATILRNPFYSEAFVNPTLRDATTLPDGTGGRALNTAPRSDLAAAAASVLVDDAHLGRSYDLTGPLWTYADLAAAVTDLTGRHVDAVATDDVPGPLGFLMRLAKAGMLEHQTPDLEHLLGRPPTTLREATAAALGAAPA